MPISDFIPQVVRVRRIQGHGWSIAGGTAQRDPAKQRELFQAGIHSDALIRTTLHGSMTRCNSKSES
jgi:hypothetical protein